MSPKLPETRLRQKLSDDNTFSVDGLKITVVIPMKQWRIEYNGVMKGFKNTQSIYVVSLDVIWTDWSGLIDLRDIKSPQVIAMENAQTDNWSLVVDVEE